MVITCPKCSARYKLSQDKIQGRGAKITCPRCNNVFVVFNDARAPAATDGAARARSAPTGGGDPTPTGSRMPTAAPQARSANEPATMGAAAGLAGGLGDLADRGAAPRAPDDSPSARAGNGVSAPEPGPRETTFEVGPRADRLNFREVGIQTWKVRVAIGLTYDFSDVSTLRRYLDDRKVTAEDQISWDGRSWVRIGEVGDLDRYFIRVWSEARDRVASGEFTPARPGRTGSFRTNPPAAGDAGALAAAVAAAEDEVDGVSPLSTRTLTQPSLKAASASGARSPSTPPARTAAEADAAANAFRVDLKLPPARKGRPSKEQGSSRRGGALGSVALLAVVAGAVWWATREPAGGGAEAVASSGAEAGGTAVAAGSSETSMDRFRKRYEDSLRKQRMEVAQRGEGASASEEGDAEVTTESRIVPVAPTRSVRPAEPVPRADPSPNPVAKAAPRAPAAAAPSPATGSTGRVVSVDASASDFAEAGKVALARQDWATAISQYETAVALDGQSAAHRYQLGRALAGAGRAADAEAHFRRALDINPGLTSAWRILGELADRQGDRARAAEHYRRYLDTTPSAPDAAAVRSRLADLGS